MLGFLSYLLSIVVGTVLGIIMASLFPEQWKEKLYFVKRKAALGFRRPNINLTLLSRTKLGEDLPEKVFRKRVLALTRQEFKPNRKGASIHFSIPNMSCSIDAEVSPLLRVKKSEDGMNDMEDDSDEQDQAYAYNVILSSKDARYKILGDNLTDLIAQHSNIKELLHQEFPDATSRIGKATLEVKLNKAPTVLAYLDKLDIMSLDTKKDDLEISFTGRRVEIRGPISAKVTNTVKELVTWYY